MENSSEKIFAGDSFFTEGGRLNIASTDPLTVAFIGGSLTEGEIDYEGTELGQGNLKWSNIVLRFLAGLFPFRKLRAVNAGLGGTTSEYGAVRFERDVLRYDPDLIFIEFSCNDRPFSQQDCVGERAEARQAYLENMIRQCMDRPKVPAVVYMHVPQPFDPAGEEYALYRQGCMLKQAVLDHYGVGTVDAMADVLAEFDARKQSDSRLTWESFCREYYEQYDNGSFNVHPRGEGYVLFAMSVIESITKEPEKFLRPFRMRREIYCRGKEKLMGERYRYIPAASDRICYVGEWKCYDEAHPYESTEPCLLLKPRSYKAPLQFCDGVMQIENPRGASFSFETDADRICMLYPSAKGGLEAAVRVDGKEIAETSCQSVWHSMNYMGGWVHLPKGRKKVTFSVRDAYDQQVLFRFGYIAEAFF